MICLVTMLSPVKSHMDGIVTISFAPTTLSKVLRPDATVVAMTFGKPMGSRLQYLPEHPVADRHRRQGDERAARHPRAEKPYSAADRDRAGLLRHEAGQPYLWRAAEWKDRCGKLLIKSGEKPVST